MADYELVAEPRSERGKGPARRARSAGRVPAVLYGRGIENQALTVDARSLSQLLHVAGSGSPINLLVGSDRYLALAKNVDRHAVRGNVLHLDFFAVTRGQSVQVTIPVVIVGQPRGVTEGGVADQELHELLVEAPMGQVPDAIEADVTTLGLGAVLRVGALRAPEGVTILADPDLPVFSVTGASELVEEEATTDAVSPEPGSSA